MICGKCKDRDVTTSHVRDCYAGRTIQAAVLEDPRSLVEVIASETDSIANPAPLPTLIEEPVEGFYERDGHYFKVVQSENTGQFYAYEGEPQPGEKWEWEYAGKRPMHHLTAANRLTAEQAAALGKLTERCVFCNRKLTDGRSTDVGYGPDCADREGLPWG